MNRPQDRRVRSLLITSVTSVIAFAALGLPAEAATIAKGTISAGQSGLSVRTGPSTLQPRLTTIRTGTTVTIECQVIGQPIVGRVRQTNRWDRLSNGRYMSDAFVRRSTTPGLCKPGSPGATNPGSPGALPPATGGTPSGSWVRPVPYRTVQGFRTRARPQHDGEDFMAPRYTPIRAVAAGTVVTVTCNSSQRNCDIDGSPAVRGCGWYLKVRHVNDVVTRYCHLVRRPSVEEGARVQVNQVIGYVGTSGSSSGTHLHFEVHSGYPATRANAVDPIEFMRRAGASIT